MKLAVLGTGVVGKTLAAKAASLGHEVVIGTRDPAEARSRTQPGSFGEPSMADLLAGHPTLTVATFADAAAGAEMVVNATSGQATVEALRLAGADTFDGTIIVDVSNPLDFSHGFPPRLTVCNDDSIGEQVQRAFPRARVVKTLNTVNATLMVDPGALADGDHTVFLCGDDPAAKRSVEGLLRAFGWRDVLDLGGISMARGTEMFLPLWVRMYSALRTPMFSVRVVR